MKEPGHDEAVDVMVGRRLERDHAGPRRVADEDDPLEASGAHRPHDLVDHERLCLLGELRRQWVTAAARAEEIDVEHGHTLSLILHERVRARMLRPVAAAGVLASATRAWSQVIQWSFTPRLFVSAVCVSAVPQFRRDDRCAGKATEVARHAADRVVTAVQTSVTQAVSKPCTTLAATVVTAWQKTCHAACSASVDRSNSGLCGTAFGAPHDCPRWRSALRPRLA